MSTIGRHTYYEILTQGLSWASALEGVHAQAGALQYILHRNTGRPILFVGCGSSYYLGLAAAELAQARLGVCARAIPASEVLLFPDGILAPGEPPLVVAISRSGETSEVVTAAHDLQARGSDVIAIGCNRNSRLLQLAQVGIEVSQGQEVSIVQTRSFSGMFLAAQALIALAAGDQQQMHALEKLPKLADAYIGRIQSVISRVVADWQGDRFFFLGSGPHYGLAYEAALKMKEMSLTSAEAFYTLEFRHGPLSMVDEHTLVIGLLSEKGARYELAILQEVHNLGGRTLIMGEDIPSFGGSTGMILAFASGLPAPAYDVLYMPPVQLLAFLCAVSAGVDPDRPRHLRGCIIAPELEKEGKSAP